LVGSVGDLPFTATRVAGDLLSAGLELDEDGEPELQPIARAVVVVRRQRQTRDLGFMRYGSRA
jgi:hypothetical protein